MVFILERRPRICAILRLSDAGQERSLIMSGSWIASITVVGLNESEKLSIEHRSDAVLRH